MHMASSSSTAVAPVDGFFFIRLDCRLQQAIRGLLDGGHPLAQMVQSNHMRRPASSVYEAEFANGQ